MIKLLSSRPYQITVTSELFFFTYANNNVYCSICSRCNRSTTDHIFCIYQILEKKWEYNEAVHQLFIDFKKAYDSGRRDVLYNILIEFGIPMKLVRVIKMCLTETYSRVRVGKNLSAMFPIKNGLKWGDALTPLLFNFASVYTIRRVSSKPGWLEIKWYTSTSGLGWWC